MPDEPRDPSKIPDPLMASMEDVSLAVRSLRVSISGLRDQARQAVARAWDAEQLAREHETARKLAEKALGDAQADLVRAREERDRALKALAEERCAAVVAKVAAEHANRFANHLCEHARCSETAAGVVDVGGTEFYACAAHLEGTTREYVHAGMEGYDA